jgi:hypothetical protein
MLQLFSNFSQDQLWARCCVNPSIRGGLIAAFVAAISIVGLQTQAAASIVVPCLVTYDADSQTIKCAEACTSQPQRIPLFSEEPRPAREARELDGADGAATSTTSSVSGSFCGPSAMGSTLISFWPSSLCQRLVSERRLSAPEPHIRGLFHPPRIT